MIRTGLAMFVAIAIFAAAAADGELTGQEIKRRSEDHCER